MLLFCGLGAWLVAACQLNCEALGMFYDSALMAAAVLVSLDTQLLNCL